MLQGLKWQESAKTQRAPLGETLFLLSIIMYDDEGPDEYDSAEEDR